MNEDRKKDPPYSVRKVFFLYPHTLIKGIYKEIIYLGYDAFMVEDYTAILPFLVKFHHSILYVNIDKSLKDKEWLSFIKNISTFEGTISTDIGIMTDARLKKKYLAQQYLFDIGITCGFISLIPDTKKILEVIIKILDANEAKGRRKYVRVQCAEGDEFNFLHNTIIRYGQIIDISLAGLSCILLDKKLKLVPNMVLENIQLKLQGVVSMVDGTVHGLREVSEGRTHYLVLFDEEHFHPKTRENILTYICKRQADFINQKPASSIETALEYVDTSDAEESFQNKSDEQLIQDLDNELHTLDGQLQEITDIIKDRETNV